MLRIFIMGVCLTCCQRSSISVVRDFGAIHSPITTKFIRNKNAQFQPFSPHYAYTMLVAGFHSVFPFSLESSLRQEFICLKQDSYFQLLRFYLHPLANL